MQSVIHLSSLLEEADHLHLQLRSQNPHQLRTPEQRSTFNLRYHHWCDSCRVVLPDDLRADFETASARLPALPDPQNEQTRSYYNTLVFELEEQRKLLFLARRRLWTGTSSLPQEARSAIAAVCKKSYQPSTIDDLFIDSGCERHWYIPPFTPTRSQRENTALGWLDGLLVHAPERERAIVRTVCATLLANPRLTPERKTRIERVRSDVEQLEHALDLLIPYPLHPTVRATAAPLVAIAHHDEAIPNVCIALNNEVQRRSNRPDLDGSALMQQVFGPRAPILAIATDQSEQQGWMYLFTGAIMALRNPRAHTLGHATSFDETMRWLLFLSALFHALDHISVTPQPPA